MMRRMRWTRGVWVLLLLALFALTCAACAREENDNAWALLRYAYENEEGNLTDQGLVTKETGNKSFRFLRTPTVSCEAGLSTLRVDGEPVEGNSVRLETAGKHTVTVIAQTGERTGAEVDYAVEVLPEVNVLAGTCVGYPTIDCRNVIDRMELNPQLGVINAIPVVPGETQVRNFGTHDLTVYCADEAKTVYKFQFKVLPCAVSQYYDTGLGKHVLDVTVGTFDDCTVTATLDGEALEPGSTRVTRIGAHVLQVFVNDEPLDTGLMPRADELFLPVRLKIESLESDDPLEIPLAQWDASFRLDGKPVSGNITVIANGTHTLTVVDEAGNVIPNAFRIQVGEVKNTADTTEDPYQPADSLTFTFHNRHLLRGGLLAIPALLLIGGAVTLLIVRRRII